MRRGVDAASTSWARAARKRWAIIDYTSFRHCEERSDEAISIF